MVRLAGLMRNGCIIAGSWLAFSGMAYAVPVIEPAAITVAASPLDIIHAARLPEPLVATAATSAIEDQALAAGLTAYGKRAGPDDFSALTGFLAAHPSSGWSAAVWTNLGLAYLHIGYFSKALDAWQQAWKSGKDAQAANARSLVDRAIGERVHLLASLGQFDNLKAQFAEIGNRPITGSATEQLQVAHEALNLAAKDPRHLYLCGPKALKAVLLAQGMSPKDAGSLDWYRATPRGTSLAQLASLAAEKKLPYRLAYRKPGDPIPTLAVVHWKVGHFAAIVGQANGRIHIIDPVFPGNDLWVTPNALNDEASGYMLIPSSSGNMAWRTASAKEAATIWGKGPTTGNRKGTPPTPSANPPGCPKPGMCVYNIAEATVALTISDTPVGYDPPIGPSTKSTISYNQRSDTQPANFSFYNVGQKWTLNWLAYVVDDPTNPGGNVSRVMGGGGQYYYSGYNSGTGQFTAQTDDGSVLVLSSQSPSSYRRQMPDGSVEIYAQSDGATSYPRNIFLTKSIDPQGNALTFTYDSQNRLTVMADAAGRQTSFSYGTLFPLQVTQITDPFGRSASITYNSHGELSSITDTIGITSALTYDSNALVNSLTTPYGTTSFSYTAPGTSGPPRYVDVTDPLGNHEREEWLEPAPVSDSDPSATVPTGMPMAPTNQYLVYRNSYHWDKDQYIAAGCTVSGGCDYTKARSTHFLHEAPTSSGLRSNVIESVKNPLENRVWYQYPGQTDTVSTGSFDKPDAVARVLDDGSTQLQSFSYDPISHNLTQSVDPLGRTTNYAYSNGIDLQSISQKTAYGFFTTISQFAYNQIHKPILQVDASGQVTNYSYNAQGQMLSVTDALGEKTQYQYNSTGDLTTVINANNATARSFTYDGYDRIATMTDSEGWTVGYAYDAADRVTVVSYPDGSAERYTYNKLDLASFQDRLGRTWSYAYDANRNLLGITDALGNVTHFAYSPNRNLTSLTDAKGNVTQWAYDVQSRVISKQYADSSMVGYAYENTTSRVKTRTDALGQVKTFAYAQDNQVSSLTYTNAANATPNVSFGYDPYYGYLTSMVDGIGTTQYAYGAVGSVGALRVTSDAGPLPSASIAYAYDALGRLSSRTVFGAGAETFQYDGIGRVSHHGSDLGVFTLTYLGQTTQLTERALTGSSLKTDFAYLPNVNDRRLQAINNTGLSTSNYLNLAFTSNAGNQITGVTESSDVTTVYPTAATQNVSFNNLNQVTSVSGQAYTYDANGNLTSDGAHSFSWDAENRLVGINYTAQPGKATAFAYDGIGRRSSVIATPAGGGTATTTFYVWCGEQLCQARNSTGVVTREYLSEGEYVTGGSPVSFYYGYDQVFSVRRVFATNGTSPAYAYDAYGAPLQSTTPVTDFGFARMVTDPNSGLSLTHYRTYSPVFGGWLSRDSLGETTDKNYNLYSYSDLDPINSLDPSGLTRIWGNYCGPDWTGGRVESYDPKHESLYARPVGQLDNLCRNHDICYYHCRVDHLCNQADQHSCMKNCDRDLANHKGTPGPLDSPGLGEGDFRNFIISNFPLVYHGLGGGY